ncbi:MAG: PD-(D/E)XK nuclease family protein [Phycisphaerae bacterium]|jgi:hypothetical protein
MTLLAGGGPSGNGWSNWGPFALCPQLYSYLHVLKVIRVEGVALDFGGALHQQLAQWGQRCIEEDAGRDPDAYYPPGQDAYQVAIQTGGHRRLTRDMEDLLWRLVAAVVPKQRTRGWKILDVEAIYPVQVGEYPDGSPIIYAPRLDIVQESAHGVVWFDDYKTTGRPPGKAMLETYAMDGQFLGMGLIGRAYFGERFAGVRIHWIRKDDCSHWVEPVPIPRKLADRWGDVLAYQGTRRWELEQATAAGELSPWEWPATGHFDTCHRRYGEDGGRCAGMELCCWGPK